MVKKQNRGSAKWSAVSGVGGTQPPEGGDECPGCSIRLPAGKPAMAGPWRRIRSSARRWDAGEGRAGLGLTQGTGPVPLRPLASSPESGPFGTAEISGELWWDHSSRLLAQPQRRIAALGGWDLQPAIDPVRCTRNCPGLGPGDCRPPSRLRVNGDWYGSPAPVRSGRSRDPRPAGPAGLFTGLSPE